MEKVMPMIRPALRAGAATIAFAGLCGAALAQSPQTHVMNLILPNGGVAHIRYVGDTPPRVTIGGAPVTFAAFPSPFGSSSPFAEMERISAAMDRQAAAMFQQAAALSASPGLVNASTLGNLPAGSREYTFVSTMNGNGLCSRSVEITSMGNGAAPKVVSHTSGDCGAAGAFQVPTQQQIAPAPGSFPKMIMTKATGAQPSAGRIEEAALR
jgi:hypothetical protein